jgi:hypothetical protein
MLCTFSALLAVLSAATVASYPVPCFNPAPALRSPVDFTRHGTSAYLPSECDIDREQIDAARSEFLRKIFFHETPLRVVVARRINVTWFFESDLCEGFGELVFSTENIDREDVGDLILVKLKVSRIHHVLVLDVGRQIGLHSEKPRARDSNRRLTYRSGGGNILVEQGTKEPDICVFIPSVPVNFLHGIIERMGTFGITTINQMLNAGAKKVRPKIESKERKSGT